jgi:hypothetical protein
VVYGAYGEPYPVACADGYWARRPIAFDAHGNPIRRSRTRFICPEASYNRRESQPKKKAANRGGP